MSDIFQQDDFTIPPAQVVCYSMEKEKSHTYRAFPPGALALISLGLAAITIGVSVKIVPGNTSPNEAVANGHYAPSEIRFDEQNREHSLQAVVESHRREQLLLRPPKEKLVYLRGKCTVRYHWRQQCVLLNNPLARVQPPPLVTMTRLQADLRRISACYECSQIEKQVRSRSGEFPSVP